MTFAEIKNSAVKMGGLEWSTVNLKMKAGDCIETFNCVLYSQDAVKEIQDLIEGEEGWRIPTEIDFENLLIDVGWENSAMKLRGDGWPTRHGCTHEQFNLVPTGYGTNEGVLIDSSTRATMWVTGENGELKFYSVGATDYEEFPEAKYGEDQKIYCAIRLCRNIKETKKKTAKK